MCRMTVGNVHIFIIINLEGIVRQRANGLGTKIPGR